MDPDTSLRGQLLIAAPSLRDPSFLRTVVLVAEHGHEGAMGVVLNRPSDADAEEVAPALAGLVQSGAVVYLGGPVEPQAVVVLAEFEGQDEAASVIFADIGFLRADADVAELSDASGRARLFAGYAGWSEGQLEAELEEGSWFVEEPQPDDVFTRAPEGLWSEVLRRKGGPYALVATMPPDPSLN